MATDVDLDSVLRYDVDGEGFKSDDHREGVASFSSAGRPTSPEPDPPTPAVG